MKRELSLKQLVKYAFLFDDRAMDIGFGNEHLHTRKERHTIDKADEYINRVLVELFKKGMIADPDEGVVCGEESTRLRNYLLSIGYTKDESHQGAIFGDGQWC